MAHRSVFENITFIEGHEPNFQPIKSISTQLNSGFGQDQLKSLNDVKLLMANEARTVGGDCIANFKYGQKVGSFWQQLWSLDNVLWYGSGTIGKLESSIGSNP